MSNTPTLPKFSGREFYSPKPAGAPSADYDRLQSSPELPGVMPPSGPSSVGQSPAMPPGDFDPSAPDILKLIQGGKFKTPFTVTLMRRSGVHVFKSDAGQKTETKYEICKETVKEPGDLLRLVAGVKNEIYRSVNDLTLEFQLMLYLALSNGAMYVPGAPTPTPDNASIAAVDSPEV